MKFLIVFSFLFAYQALAWEIIAHRGVHQNFSSEGLTTESCTAEKTLPSDHAYLENTLSSIQKAFDLGADMVELDVHPTTETEPQNDRLVVFHDWTLNCRTNATCETCKCNDRKECVTDQQSWNYLQILDIGYGYTTDGGQTFPFRGQPPGLLPSFKEAVSLLKKNPDKKLLVNVKDHYSKTQKLLLTELMTFQSDVRSRVYVEYSSEWKKKFQAVGIPEAIWQGGGLKRCLSKYLFVGWLGYVPEVCRDQKFFVPLHMDLGIVSPHLKDIPVTKLIWGWPHKFIERLKKHGTEIYLSEVDTPEDLEYAKSLGVAGIMTNKIEVIAPFYSERTQ